MYFSFIYGQRFSIFSVLFFSNLSKISQVVINRGFCVLESLKTYPDRNNYKSLCFQSLKFLYGILRIFPKGLYGHKTAEKWRSWPPRLPILCILVWLSIQSWWEVNFNGVCAWRSTIIRPHFMFSTIHVCKVNLHTCVLLSSSSEVINTNYIKKNKVILYNNWAVNKLWEHINWIALTAYPH